MQGHGGIGCDTTFWYLYEFFIPEYQAWLYESKIYHVHKIEEISQMQSHESQCIETHVKGVLHPRPIFWLFVHFSQKLQHIGDK